MTNKKKLFLFGAIWLGLQFILVFCRWPIVFISDEILYKRISYSLFQWKPALSWHYPILYPALISPGFFFRSHFYEAMLVINILSKGIGLFLIWKLLRKESDEDRALRMLVLIGFSPIYFLYSRVLMAENLACPLLILNVLYHEHYRKKMAEGRGGKRLAYTLGAALLSLSLFWTKYLLLVTLPVFCLFWCAPLLRGEGKTSAKLFSFVKEGIVYTAVVVLSLLAYAWIYALRTDQPFTLELITGTMGFGIGSGPSNNGFAVSVEFKWVTSYVLYAVLGAALIIVGMIINTKADLLRKNREIVTLIMLLLTALIYISARHSTYVDYNKGGLMMNLCGRYVAYATPLLAICWMRTCSLERGAAVSNGRKIAGGIVGTVIVWASYELLYVLSPGVEQSSSWLTGIRAADNAGFTNMGHAFCLIYCIGIGIILFTDYKIRILVISLLMMINSFSAVLTCEEYHARDYEFSGMVKALLGRHVHDNINIMCIDGVDYSFLNGYLRFYEIDDWYDEIVIRNISDLEQALYFDSESSGYIFALGTSSLNHDVYERNQDLYEGDIEQRNVFLRWDRERFRDDERKPEVSYEDENEVRISCQGDNRTIFVCGSYILPTRWEEEENQVVAVIQKDLLEDDAIYIYDIGELTVDELQLDGK